MNNKTINLAHLPFHIQGWYQNPGNTPAFGGSKWFQIIFFDESMIPVYFIWCPNNGSRKSPVKPVPDYRYHVFCLQKDCSEFMDSHSQ